MTDAALPRRVAYGTLPWGAPSDGDDLHSILVAHATLTGADYARIIPDDPGWFLDTYAPDLVLLYIGHPLETSLEQARDVAWGHPGVDVRLVSTAIGYVDRFDRYVADHDLRTVALLDAPFLLLPADDRP